MRTYRRTALSDLLQLGDEEVNKDRLYRGLDHLLAYKTALEAYLSQRCGELFAIQNEVLLYDVTSTYNAIQSTSLGTSVSLVLAHRQRDITASIRQTRCNTSAASLLNQPIARPQARRACSQAIIFRYKRHFPTRHYFLVSVSPVLSQHRSTEQPL
jgi:hypothetical protein